MDPFTPDALVGNRTQEEHDIHSSYSGLDPSPAPGSCYYRKIHFWHSLRNDSGTLQEIPCTPWYSAQAVCSYPDVHRFPIIEFTFICSGKIYPFSALVDILSRNSSSTALACSSILAGSSRQIHSFLSATKSTRDCVSS